LIHFLRLLVNCGEVCCRVLTSVLLLQVSALVRCFIQFRLLFVASDPVSAPRLLFAAWSRGEISASSWRLWLSAWCCLLLVFGVCIVLLAYD
jgi:hypothetical protein